MMKFLLPQLQNWPRFAWIGAPALLFGTFAAADRIDFAMQIDLTNAHHLLVTSISVIVAIISLSGLIILRMYSEMRKARLLACTDELTGLINRREFNRVLGKEIQSCKETGKDIGLIALDLDRFKVINDSYGHEAGDAVICQFGNRIRSVLRSNDVVSRISGDEFFVMLRSIRNENQIRTIAERILEAMKEPFIYNDIHIPTTTSLGCAYIPQGTESNNSAMRKADFALLRSKEMGRNCLVQFDPQMAEAIRSRRELEIKLREAVANNALSTRYQPIICQQSGNTVGVEALVRWKLDDGTDVPPSEFIPLASELNLAEEIGNFVLERACEEVGWINDDIRLAVNISIDQFMRDNFVASVEQTLARTGFPADRLEIEVPQSLLAMNFSEIADKLEDLRSRGIRIALDDFGTGYSNFMFLRQFKLDRIKLDRSFIRKMELEKDGAKMVANMIELGASISDNVTVKGVETDAHLRHLSGSSCNELQGYYFSKPLTAQELISKTAADGLKPVRQKLRLVDGSGQTRKLIA